MTKNKVVVLIITVVIVGVVIVCCSKSSQDKFVGVWYKSGLKSDEITKNGDKYSWQTYYDDGKKGVLYEDGFISEGYLLFSASSKKYFGFKYKSEDELISMTFYKPYSKSKPKPGECEKEEDGILTRGK